MLASATYEAARAMLPGWDVYALEAEWRAWWVETGPPAAQFARQGVPGLGRLRRLR
jgi:hypothetical protein